MKKKVKKEMIIEKCVSYICDKCGKEYLCDGGSEMDILEIEEFLHIDFIGGYGSVFGDGSRVSADICQHCLREMIKDFATVIFEGIVW